MKKTIILTVSFVIILTIAFLFMSYRYSILQKKIDTTNERITAQITQIQKLESDNHKYKTMNEDLTYQLEISTLKNEAYESAALDFPVTISEEEIDMMAKTILGEAGCCSTYEQSMVAWCILNRLDTGRWGNRVAGVVAAPYQFHGYIKSYPVEPEIRALVIDVIVRWQLEKMYGWNVGRTLPADMINFHANDEGTHNLFYNDKIEYYDWSAGFDPYSK